MQPGFLDGLCFYFKGWRETKPPDWGVRIRCFGCMGCGVFHRSGGLTESGVPGFVVGWRKADSFASLRNGNARVRNGNAERGSFCAGWRNADFLRE